MMTAATGNELESLYADACKADTDIHEHLPLLRQIARHCRHVTEFGTRAGNSTVALLAGLADAHGADPGPCRTLVCYDVARYQEQVERLDRLAGPVNFFFFQKDVRAVEIEATDLLLIDTWHAYEQLRRELALHAGKVKKWIALHDTTSYADVGEGGATKGLWPAVEEFLLKGTFKVRNRFTNCNGLTILERIAPEPDVKAGAEPAGAHVYLAIPFYQDIVGQCVDGYDNAVDPYGPNSYAKWYSGGSFHCRNFNDQWCGALNSRHYGWTHFAMIHQDVQPKGHWLDVMLDEMRKADADLLSVVLPIKNYEGLTSTAMRHRETGVVRRLTMREVWQPHVPVTFDAAQAGFPEYDLLASTGLWICDFTRPWVEEVYFDNPNRIVKLPDGLFAASCVSEDWLFSAMLHARGLKVVATKAVPALHWGMTDFRNDMPWGTEETDKGAAPFGDWFTWPK